MKNRQMLLRLHESSRSQSSHTLYLSGRLVVFEFSIISDNDKSTCEEKSMNFSDNRGRLIAQCLYMVHSFVSSLGYKHCLNT